LLISRTGSTRRGDVPWGRKPAMFTDSCPCRPQPRTSKRLRDAKLHIHSMVKYDGVSKKLVIGCVVSIFRPA
jgi:hypothetical protein